MATIVAVETKSKKEIVVLWSNLLSEEINHIQRLNPDIVSIEILERYPSKNECLDVDKERGEIRYNLPKIYVETRRKGENQSE